MLGNKLSTDNYCKNEKDLNATTFVHTFQYIYMCYSTFRVNLSLLSIVDTTVLNTKQYGLYMDYLCFTCIIFASVPLPNVVERRI